MEPSERTALEEEIGAALDAGDPERAITAAIRGYGPELLGFLCARQADEDRVHEAFSLLCEDLWKGIGGFQRRSSFRTWMYVVARGALSRCLRSDQRHGRRMMPLSRWGDAAEQVRSATMPFLRTSVQDRFTALRNALPEDDQELLILRVDRKLEWADLAQVLSGRDDLAGEELKRESARLRKRFQIVKDRLREAALRDGLLEPSE